MAVLLGDIENRVRIVPKRDSQAYIVERARAGDPEWAQILRDRPDWAEHYTALANKARLS